MPNNCRVYIASLLLSAAKVDRDQDIEGGIYENLFLSLKILIVDSIKMVNEPQNKSNISHNMYNSLP